MAEFKVHYYQKAILKNLTMHPTLTFNRLLIKGLESEHMNYHLKQLISNGYVMKKKDGYSLSDKGKDYCNLLDDDVNIIEKQPKSSIIIWGERINPKTNEIENLLNIRLRQPYFGKLGRITGKIRFGETIQQTAVRELYEETGLQADNYKLVEIYHKLRHRENGEHVQDVIFYIFYVTEFKGELITKTEFQENFWISLKEFKKHKDFDVYDDFKFDNNFNKSSSLKFIENDSLAEGF